MPGIYYTPQDPYSGLAKGLMQGADLGMQAFKLKKELELADSQMEKSSLEQEALKRTNAHAEKVQLAEEEIADRNAKFQIEYEKLQATKRPSEAAPVKTNIPRLQDMSGFSGEEMASEANNINQDLRRKMDVGVTPEQYNATREKTSLEYEGNKRIYDATLKKTKDIDDQISHMSGKHMGDIRNTYLKHGLVEEASKYTKQQVEQIKALGEAGVSPEQMFNVSKGLYPEFLGNAVFSPVKEKPGTYKVANLEGGGSIILDTTTGGIKARIETPGKYTTVVRSIVDGDAERTAAITTDSRGNVVGDKTLGSGRRWKPKEGGEGGEGGAQGSTGARTAEARRIANVNKAAAALKKTLADYVTRGGSDPEWANRYELAVEEHRQAAVNDPRYNMESITADLKKNIGGETSPAYKPKRRSIESFFGGE